MLVYGDLGASAAAVQAVTKSTVSERQKHALTRRWQRALSYRQGKEGKDERKSNTLRLTGRKMVDGRGRNRLHKI